MSYFNAITMSNCNIKIYISMLLIYFMWTIVEISMLSDSSEPMRFSIFTTWIFIISIHFLLAITSTAVFRYQAPQTAQLITALDPLRGKRWERYLQAVHKTALAICISCGVVSGVLLTSNSPYEREHGAYILTIWFLICSTCNVFSMWWVKRDLLKIKSKLAARTNTQAAIASELKVQNTSIAYSMVAISVAGVQLWIQDLRNAPVCCYICFWIPTTILLFIMVPTVRLKRIREENRQKQQRGRNKVGPILAQKARAKRTVADAVQQFWESPRFGSGSSSSGSGNSSNIRSGECMGVSLLLLQKFADEKGVGKITSSDLCSTHIKPLTCDTGEGKGSSDKRSAPLVCILKTADDGDETGEKWCGPCTHFVSYSWSVEFDSLVNMLQRFEEENPNRPGEVNYYFVDMFILDQHALNGYDTNDPATQQELLSTLKHNIRTPGKVLVCLSPWDAPTPLTRCWCLYEIYIAIVFDCEVHMCMSDAGAAAFYAALHGNGTSGFDIRTLLGSVDAANANATVASDKSMILGEIAGSIGVATFDSKVQGFMESALKELASSLVLKGAVFSTKKTPKQREKNAVEFGIGDGYHGAGSAVTVHLNPVIVHSNTHPDSSNSAVEGGDNSFSVECPSSFGGKVDFSARSVTNGAAISDVQALLNHLTAQINLAPDFVLVSNKGAAGAIVEMADFGHSNSIQVTIIRTRYGSGHAENGVPAPIYKVELRGRIYRAAGFNTDVLLFTLPDGYRPSQEHNIICQGHLNDGQCRVDVHTSGAVIVPSEGTSNNMQFVNFSTVSFWTH